MTMTSVARENSDRPAPAENPFAPQWIADPYPMYARLREQGPTFLVAGNFWLLTRYSHVELLLRDTRFGRSSGAALQPVFGTGPLQQSISRWMLVMDPPDHTRLRSLVSQAFTPRAVERHRNQIQQVVDQLLDRVDGAGQFDLIGEFAYPLPVQVICALLGVPLDDCEHLRPWSAGVTRSLDAVVSRNPQLISGGDAGAAGLTDYFQRLVALRRAEPRDDLLSALIAARDGADRLTEDELLATCVMLFFGGHETTVNLIGNGMLALLRHPDQLERMRADVSLIPSAVEELLRYDSPVQRVGQRFAREDIDLGGVVIHQGEAATGFIGAANRDPDQFSNPDDLDVARSNNRHLSFAAGIHYCLGAALARLEAQVAFASLLARLPELHLLADTPSWRQTPTLRGLETLPLGLATRHI